MNKEEFIKEMKESYRLAPDVYRKILDASMKSRNWTEQSMIIMEELAELSQQVSKGARGEHDPYDLILEMADVVACLDMLMAHYEITEDELDRALAVKSVYIGKKLGLVNGAKDTMQNLNDAIDLMSYEFNLDDEVITTDKVLGRLVDICKCSECGKRGFYELTWRENLTGEEHNITIYDAKNGFKGYHRIGKYVFHPEDKEPAIKYPSGEAMVNRLRIFCGDQRTCLYCPLFEDFCKGRCGTLGFRFMAGQVSTQDVYDMYRIAFIKPNRGKEKKYE